MTPALSRWWPTVCGGLSSAILLVWWTYWLCTAAPGRIGFESSVLTSDLRPTMTAAGILRRGRGADLYDLRTQAAAQGDLLRPLLTELHEPALAADAGKIEHLLVFLHMPIEAQVILLVLGGTPSIIAAAVLWTLLQAAAFGLGIGLLTHWCPLRPDRTLLLTVGASCWGASITSMLLMQNSGFVFCGAVLAWGGWKQRSVSGAAAGLALVALKPQLALIWALVWLLTGAWRAVLGAALWWGAWAVISIPMLGFTWPLSYLTLVARIGQENQSFGISASTMYNWRGFWLQLRGFGISVHPILPLLTVGLTAVALWWVWRDRRWSRLDKAPEIRHWTALYVATTLLAYHLHLHDLSIGIVLAWAWAALAERGGLGDRYLPAIAVAFFSTWVWLGGTSLLGWMVIPNVTMMAAWLIRLVCRPNCGMRQPQAVDNLAEGGVS